MPSSSDSAIKYRHPKITQLWLYRRPNSKVWQCSFHHQGRNFRKSTGARLRHEAEDVSYDWYLEQQVELRSGKQVSLGRKSKTVKDASILAVNEYRALVAGGRKSPLYLETIIRFQNKHVLPHFGNMNVEAVTQQTWRGYTKGVYEKNPGIAPNTVHQIRNALAVCLNAAEDAGWIDAAPSLKNRHRNNEATKRVWFEPDEQLTLLAAVDANAQQDYLNPKHKEGAAELRDYVKWMLYSGLRVGEAKSLRFRHVGEVADHLQKKKTHLKIRVPRNKVGPGDCNPDRAIQTVWKELCERRSPFDADEKLFLHHHREMFNRILNQSKLKQDSDGRSRDFVSLRHTYISNRLREGVPIFDVAHNCRTSVAMIDKHYARHMKPEHLTSLHKESDARIEFNRARMATLQDNIKRDENELERRLVEIANHKGIKVEEARKQLPDVLGEWEALFG